MYHTKFYSPYDISWERRIYAPIVPVEDEFTSCAGAGAAYKRGKRPSVSALINDRRMLAAKRKHLTRDWIRERRWAS